MDTTSGNADMLCLPAACIIVSRSPARSPQQLITQPFDIESYRVGWNLNKFVKYIILIQAEMFSLLMASFMPDIGLSSIFTLN